MGLVIRAPRRLRTSRRFTFDDDVELVVIGRDPDRCDIMFPPRTRAVGLEHMALKRVLGRYRLVLNADDPVFVNGEEAVDGQELPDRSVIRLGARGPRLVVERTTRTDLPPVHREMKAHGRRASPRQLLSSVRRNRNLALAAAALVVAVAGLLIWSTWRPEPPEEPPAEARLRAALEQAAPSVYRVVLRTPDGGEYSGATAWIVAPGTLATNAHVAKQFEERPPGARFQVRSSESVPKTYDVQGVTLHPGFEAFAALWSGYQPAEGASPGRLQPIQSAGGGADVALLHVDPHSDLGPPLRLAEDPTLHALSPGEPVGYVGYPSEAIALHGSPVQRPTPHRQTGRITLVTTLFGTQEAAEGRHLIQHTCPGTGGASGSPLLNADGLVVGLVSAGNFAQAWGGRIPSGVGISYAQRADLLRELLEDRAEALQPERTHAWLQSLEEIYPSAWRINRRRLLELQLRRLSDLHQTRTSHAEYIDWVHVSTTTVDVGTESVPEADRPTVDVPERGLHVLYALPLLFRELELAGRFVPESGLAVNMPSHQGFLRFQASDPGSLQVALTSKRFDAQVELLLYREVHRATTPAFFQERVFEAWQSELEGHRFARRVTGEPTLALEDDHTLDAGTNQRWTRPLSCRVTGFYLVVAAAREDLPVTLVVTGLDPEFTELTRASPSPGRYVVFVGRGKSGEEGRIRIARGPGVRAEAHVVVKVWVVPASDTE